MIGCHNAILGSCKSNLIAIPVTRVVSSVRTLISVIRITEARHVRQAQFMNIYVRCFKEIGHLDGLMRLIMNI